MKAGGEDLLLAGLLYRALVALTANDLNPALRAANDADTEEEEDEDGGQDVDEEDYGESDPAASNKLSATALQTRLGTSITGFAGSKKMKISFRDFCGAIFSGSSHVLQRLLGITTSFVYECELWDRKVSRLLKPDGSTDLREDQSQSGDLDLLELFAIPRGGGGPRDRGGDGKITRLLRNADLGSTVGKFLAKQQLAAQCWQREESSRQWRLSDFLALFFELGLGLGSSGGGVLSDEVPTTMYAEMFSALAEDEEHLDEEQPAHLDAHLLVNKLFLAGRYP
eukprot:g18904.t1